MNFLTKRKIIKAEEQKMRDARERWRSLVEEFLRYSIDDTQDLLRCLNSEYSKKLVKAAGVLADAVIDADSERWGL